MTGRACCRWSRPSCGPSSMTRGAGRAICPAYGWPCPGRCGCRSASRERFERLAGCPVVEGYGTAETSPVTHVNPVPEFRRRPDPSAAVARSAAQAGRRP